VEYLYVTFGDPSYMRRFWGYCAKNRQTNGNENPFPVTAVGKGYVAVKARAYPTANTWFEGMALPRPFC